MESLGTVNSGVAHSLKNQLAQIQMGIEALRALRPKAEPTSDDTEASVLSIIDGAIDRADAMLDSLIRFSSEFEFSLQPGDFNEIVRSTLDQFEPQAKACGVTITAALAPGLPSVLVDRQQFPQIIGHLLSNALDAMPEGGELIATTSLSDPRTAQPEGTTSTSMLSLVIEDSGVGIGEENLSKVFIPFFSTKAAAGRGCGLGLTLVEKLVALHGGTVSIDDRACVGGVRATVRLQVAPDARLEAPD